MARKRFVAKPVGPKDGIVKGRHVVRLSDGTTQSVVYKKSVRPRSGAEKPPVRKAKVNVLNRLPTQEARFRAIMRKATRDFEQKLRATDQPRFRRSDGRLKAQTRARLERELQAIVSQTTKEMRDSLLANVQGSVKTYLRGIKQAAPDKLISLEEIDRLSRSVALSTYRETINGATAADRVALLASRLERELKAQIGKDRSERAEGKKRLERALVDPKGSGQACVARGLSRLNRTEQSRAMQTATIRVLQRSGAKYAYWRLSAAHKWYGGGEICEVLASNNGADVDYELAKDGLSLSTEGLYLVNAFPSIPHSNCMCSIDPVF